jgi:peptidyl-prolyl cis-trans isomerase B (cyclophilin B)
VTTGRKIALVLAFVLPALGLVPSDARAESAPGAKPVVVLTTSLGEIELELDAAKAPITVANFLQYVDDGFYDGVIFHRVIKDFMIQGGGFTPSMQQKKARDPIRSEANNGLENLRGTIAMARTNDPHSAGAQWFINHKDNAFLNHTAPTTSGWGYTVFGHVTRGMDVVDKIAAVPTATKAGMGDVPTLTVAIVSARRKK